MYSVMQSVYFTTTNFAKLTPAHRHHVGIFRIQFHPHRLENVEISVRFVFTPCIKLSLSLNRLLRNTLVC
jgi:hypothetical protein